MNESISTSANVVSKRLPVLSKAQQSFRLYIFLLPVHTIYLVYDRAIQSFNNLMRLGPNLRRNCGVSHFYTIMKVANKMNFESDYVSGPFWEDIGTG